MSENCEKCPLQVPRALTNNCLTNNPISKEIGVEILYYDCTS